MEELKKKVQDFWNQNPCGAKLVKSPLGSDSFFAESEKERYATESHILGIINSLNVRGKNILEIGCGLGVDGACFAKNKANYFAIDLALRHLLFSQKRFEMFNLKGNFQLADSENLPFRNEQFDLVYSNGVLHHTPDTQKAINEIYRVLKFNGKVIVMLYNKKSFNFYFNIMFLRRLGIFLLLFNWGRMLIHKLTGESLDRLNKHLSNFKNEGFHYLSAQRFLKENTDGPGNPLSKVYTRQQAVKLFSMFKKVRTEIWFLNKKRIPFIGLFFPKWLESKIERLWGWHLYIFAEK